MMKRVLSVVAMMAATTAYAGPPEGLYKTGDVGNGTYYHVSFSNCDSGICGVVQSVFSVEGGNKLDGHADTKRAIIQGMSDDGKGYWSGGTAWRASNGKTYRSKMATKGKDLKVSGCIGPVCIGQTWERLD